AAVSAPPAEAHTPAVTGPTAPPKPAVTPQPNNKAVSPFTWRQIESEDYKQYIANLRNVGCPEQTIRDIIIADVNKLYAAREAPLKPKPSTSGKSAQTQVAISADELEKRRQLREIQMEKRSVLKELLGIDVPLDLLPSSGSRNYDNFELALKLLSPEKRD